MKRFQDFVARRVSPPPDTAATKTAATAERPATSTGHAAATA